jgi:hypothetical protein
VWAAYAETSCYVMGNATAILGRVTGVPVPAFSTCAPRKNAATHAVAPAFMPDRDIGVRQKMNITCIWH